jgi:hypothetical protein
VSSVAPSRFLPRTLLLCPHVGRQRLTVHRTRRPSGKTCQRQANRDNCLLGHSKRKPNIQGTKVAAEIVTIHICTEAQANGCYRRVDRGTIGLLFRRTDLTRAALPTSPFIHSAPVKNPSGVLYVVRAYDREGGRLLADVAIRSDGVLAPERHR